MSSSATGEDGGGAAAVPQGPVPVERVRAANGLEKVILREVRGNSVEVYLYGGHVTSWKEEHGEELLFVSNKAIFKPPKAIRGGIPICFPQFSNFGHLEAHGFARNKTWAVDADPPPFPVPVSSRAYIDLILKPTEEDLKIWPHSFEYRLRIALGPGGDLMLTSRIRNTNADGKAFSFTFAYHTYFSISDIRSTSTRKQGFGAIAIVTFLKPSPNPTGSITLVLQSREDLLLMALHVVTCVKSKWVRLRLQVQSV